MSIITMRYRNRSLHNTPKMNGHDDNKNVKNSSNKSKENFRMTIAAVAAVLLLFSSAITACFAQPLQHTNTPPVLTVPTSPLALGTSTLSSDDTLAVVLASYVSASDIEDRSLSSQIQCSSETNTLRPTTNAFNFPAGTTIVTCSVSDNGIRDENKQQIAGTVRTVYKHFALTVTILERDEDNNGVTNNGGGYATDTSLQREASSNVGQLDTTAPVTRIVASSVQKNGITNQRTAIFTVAATDSAGVASYECRIDGRPIIPCKNPVSISGLGDGIHNFVAAAIDNAGNRDSTPEHIVWEIDTTAPVISGLPPTQDPLLAIATGPTRGEIRYATPTATDTRDGALRVTCSPASGSTIASGVGTRGNGICTATDLAKNTVTKAFSYRVVWPAIAFPISPINTADGTTKFILGSTIPVKFKVDPVPGFGHVTEIKAKIYYAKIDSVIPSGGTIVSGSTLAAAPGNEFRYTTNGEYVFNLGTQSVTTGQGKYQISADFGDGTKKSILISLVNPPTE